jgi:hypothetical protein
MKRVGHENTLVPETLIFDWMHQIFFRQKNPTDEGGQRI